MTSYRAVIDEVDWIPLQRENKGRQNSLLQRNDYSQKAVCMLPTIDRGAASLTVDQQMMYALICQVGEYSSLNTAQIFCINRIFHDRPHTVSFADWMEATLNQPLVGSRLYYKAFNGLEENIYSKLTQEMKTVLEVLQANKKLIFRLLRSKVQDMDWRDLTAYLYWKPITASRFLLATRPCEHVVLCKRMLHWARITPDTTDHGQTDYVIPEQAPEDWRAYEELEWGIRRRQRCYFPGLTSLEVSVLIFSEFEDKIFF